MNLPFQTKKSAGVAVPVAVYRVITRGNAARERKDWIEAARLFQHALQMAPSLGHIWVQLGNMLKEAGNLSKAETAYQQAVDLNPSDTSPLIQLGHVAKLSGDLQRASTFYLRALKLDPHNSDAISELHRLVVRTTGHTRDSMIDLLRSTIGAKPNETSDFGTRLHQAQMLLNDAMKESATVEHTLVLKQAHALLASLGSHTPTHNIPGAETKVAIVFDASDLISYFSYARLPTGIQRVQIEAITNGLKNGDRPIHVCCFVDGREDWLEIPPEQFLYLTQLSIQDGERDQETWIRALNRLHLTLVLAQPFEFPLGAYLVNLGTSWGVKNYFLHVRYIKTTRGVRYIPFVHDLIAIIEPKHFVEELVQDFISWILGVFAHADHYLVNSESTKRDLFRVASILCAEVGENSVVVVPLDADFRRSGLNQLSPKILGKWGLIEQPFVMMVGTVESRKGHIFALDAWVKLITRHGARKVPKLVIVGRRGWLNTNVYQRLEQHANLRKHVVMLSNLPDDELALLYQSSLFTIYPSLYEGWGLPITESLCYGKAVITSDNSSLREAGSDFAVYIETGSVDQLASAVEKMTFDVVYRRAIEAKIANGFKPRSWRDVASQIETEVSQLAASDAGSSVAFHPPLARQGAYYPVRSNVETRIWPGIGSGEIFRSGMGWLWPEPWGTWTRPQGGSMTIGLPDRHSDLQIFMLIHGLPTRDCEWAIQIKGQKGVRGSLRSGERRLITFPYLASGSSLMNLRLTGSTTEMVRLRGGGAEQEALASVGLCGFFFHDVADEGARVALLEAVAFDALEKLNLFADPSSIDVDEIAEPTVWNDALAGFASSAWLIDPP